jgi:hypothetical protein
MYRYIPGYKGLIIRFDGLIKPRRQGLNNPGYHGLNKQRFDGLNGLSIIYITPFQTGRQIDKAICRQIDKPSQTLKWGYPQYEVYSIYHQSNGLSNPQSKTVYKRYTNIPIYTHTLAIKDIRFEGLDICPNIRFG